MKNFRRYEGETEEQLLFRLGSEKDANELSWIELSKILNNLTGNDYTESRWRKKFSEFNKMYESNKSTLHSEEFLDELEEKKAELYKEQVKTRDLLNQYRSTLRDEARIQRIVDAISEDNTRFEPEILPYKGITNGQNEAILCIGDWHIGDECYNFYNEFNIDIAVERINKLIQKTVNYCHKNNVKKLNVLNLGDMINGSIHVTNRIENEIDSIQQIKMVVRLLFDLLINLNSEIEFVSYRSVLDNHSRLTVNYKEHIEKESFAKLIDYWLIDKIDAYNYKNKDLIKNPIIIENDNIDDNIGFLKINDKNIFFSHGHIGSQNSVLQDLTFATGIVADMVLLGHWHTDKIKNYQGKKVYFNGSLKGVDSYALNHRLFSKPTQNLLIFDEEDVIDIPMNLD